MATPYRGRFAPSPTGPLHFGSLVGALASYLDARANNGQWLVRIEDVDSTRCHFNFTQSILETLSSYHLISDLEIRFQSQHTANYQQLLDDLIDRGHAFCCNCSRKDLADNNGLHPGICASTCELPHSWRLKVASSSLSYEDGIQGMQRYHFHETDHSPVLKRKDNDFSYQLAVVADDHNQQITHIVRGSDLLETTGHQLYLYQLFDWPAPSISHTPIILDLHNKKLSKQNHAKAIANGCPDTLNAALSYLGIQVINSSVQSQLQAAIRSWQPERLQGKAQTLRQRDQHLS